MAMSFIGKPISLISHSDVRYRGILAGIDPTNSTIQLQNVFSMGTENRRPPAEFIEPAEQPYQYIIFRASEVKDLAVDPVDPPPRRNLHDDPAVIGASAPSVPSNGYSTYPDTQYSPTTGQPAQPQVPQAPRQQPVPATLGTRPPPTVRAPEAAPQPTVTANTNDTPSEPQTSNPPSNSGRRGSAKSVHTAAASLETVERALGDLRISNASAAQPVTNGLRTGRRGGGGRAQEREIKVPQTDFDFVGSNARFDKAALSPGGDNTEAATAKDDDEKTNPSDDEKGAESSTKEAKEKEKAYNPKASFFDSLSSSSNSAPQPHGGRGGGGGRRGHGRNRREEEREKNVATFGEPGGLGLMGPGAYVQGWGGYGRSGGPRRGGGRRGMAPAVGAR